MPTLRNRKWREKFTTPSAEIHFILQNNLGLKEGSGADWGCGCADGSSQTATLAEARTEAVAIRIIHEAMDAGVNFMDNAREYHDGRSEKWMGKALKGRRDKAFLMTKVCAHGRDANVAMRQLEESLRRLQTDHLDVWQVHEVIFELYKTSKKFDCPPGREQHGFPLLKEMAG